MEKLAPRDLRRSFVSEQLDACVDTTTVAAMAGHSRVTITQGHGRRGEEAKRKVAGCFMFPYTKKARSKIVPFMFQFGTAYVITFDCISILFSSFAQNCQVETPISTINARKTLSIPSGMNLANLPRVSCAACTARIVSRSLREAAMNDSGTKEGFAAEVKQFISFTVGTEEYGLELLRVKEVIRMRQTTWLPKAPPMQRESSTSGAMSFPLWTCARDSGSSCKNKLR